MVSASAGLISRYSTRCQAGFWSGGGGRPNLRVSLSRRATLPLHDALVVCDQLIEASAAFSVALGRMAFEVFAKSGS